MVSYLKNEGNVRDPKKPFFIMVGMNPPHSPYRSLDDQEEDFNLYKTSLWTACSSVRMPTPKMLQGRECTLLLCFCDGVDRAFGQIIFDALKELGLDKNTIVVFASDHGETM